MTPGTLAERPHNPVLRYHGGKWRLAPWIIQHFPPHRTYVEAFGGAASVLLRKPRSYAEIYNDLDGEIVNAFRILRDRTTAIELERLLRLTPFARAEFEQAYAPTDDPVEQARRTITRSYLGFGSAAASGRATGFRANSTRSGTTPAHDWASYPARIAAFTRRLAGVTIENRDALAVMRSHDDPGTLHYVDPPYLPSTRSLGNPYDRNQYRHEMTDDQHAALAAALRDLRGMVVLSGYASGLYERLYGDWEQVTRTAHADGARPRTEVLWLNPAAIAALSDWQPDLYTQALDEQRVWDAANRSNE